MDGRMERREEGRKEGRIRGTVVVSEMCKYKKLTWWLSIEGRAHQLTPSPSTRLLHLYFLRRRLTAFNVGLIGLLGVGVWA